VKAHGLENWSLDEEEMRPGKLTAAGRRGRGSGRSWDREGAVRIDVRLAVVGPDLDSG
jgi:hypothetical protein